MDRALLARIRKCFALSASSNEHEAAAALAKARELMRDHGVTEADLAMAEVEEATARGSRCRRPSGWEADLANCVMRALGVETMLDGGGDWIFLGRGPSAEIASYAFAALFRRLKAARAAYIKGNLRRCSPARKRARADAFCEGWARSVYSKVARLAPDRGEDAAIVAYMAKRFPNTVTVSAREATGKRTDSDFYRGHAAGRDIDLHHGVHGASTTQAITHG